MTDLSGQSGRARRFAAGLWSGLVGLVYPPVCLACGIIVGRHGALCAGCWSTVHFIDRPFCPVLGVPFPHQLEDGMVSPAAIAASPAFTRARAAVLYDDVARQFVHRLKYSDRLDLAHVMAAWMLRASDGTVAGADIVVAVPLHRTRLLTRRYNQSAELARALCRLAGKPHGVGLLIRRRPTRQQVGLGEKARERNVRGAFVVPEARTGEIAGRRVVLVDDVYTTGATVNAASRALKRAGAADITVLTFARVADPQSPA